MVTAQRWQLFKVGRTLGTAKLAKVVGVKFSTSGAGPKPENTIRAWRWAINDVNTKGRDGKAVFLHPFGKVDTQISSVRFLNWDSLAYACLRNSEPTA